MTLAFSVKFNDSTIIFFSLIHTCALHVFINLITIFEILYNFLMTILLNGPIEMTTWVVMVGEHFRVLL